MWRGRSRHREALLARHAPRGGCLRPASETSNRTRLRRGVGRFHFHGETRAPPTTGRARTPHRRPGVPAPTARGTHTRHAARARRRDDGRRVKPPPDGRRGARRRRRACGAAPARGRSPCGVRRGEGPGPSRRNSPPARPPPPTHGRTGDTPQGVFKPPRRNALGTWTARGRTRRGGPDQRPAPRLSRRPSGKAGAESQRAGPGGAAQRGAAEAAGTRLGPDGSRRDGNDDDGPRRRGGHRDPPRRDAENRPRPPRPPTRTPRPRPGTPSPRARARARTHTRSRSPWPLPFSPPSRVLRLSRPAGPGRSTNGTRAPPAHAPQGGHGQADEEGPGGTAAAFSRSPLMILPQVHLRKPCYDFYFL